MDWNSCYQTTFPNIRDRTCLLITNPGKSLSEKAKYIRRILYLCALGLMKGDFWASLAATQTTEYVIIHMQVQSIPENNRFLDKRNEMDDPIKQLLRGYQQQYTPHRESTAWNLFKEPPLHHFYKKTHILVQKGKTYPSPKFHHIWNKKDEELINMKYYLQLWARLREITSCSISIADETLVVFRTRMLLGCSVNRLQTFGTCKRNTMFQNPVLWHWECRVNQPLMTAFFTLMHIFQERKP